MKSESLKSLLPKSGFAHGVSVLVSGTALAQLIMVLASPLLTRLYSPEVFGEFAVYVSILSVLTVISSCRYQLAIPGAENDEDALNLLILCLVCAAVFAVIFLFVLLFLGNRIEELLSVPITGTVIAVFVIGIFLTGILQAIDCWAIRERAYPKIAKAKIQKSITTVCIQVVGFIAGAASLLSGHIIGHAISSLSLIKSTLKTKKIKVKASYKTVKKQAWRHRQYPIYSTWGGLLNSAGMELPPILFAALFNPAVAGIYMLAHRVLASPAGIITQAVGQVFFGNARQELYAGNFRVYTGQLHRHLSMLSAPAVICIFLFAPHLFGLVFGQEWILAGDYARWLSLMLYFQFISSPLTNVFNILELQKKTLFYNILLIILRIVGILTGVWYGSEYIAVIMFSLLSALGYLIFSLGTTGSAGVRKTEICMHHVKAILLACLLLIVPYILLDFYNLTYTALSLAVLFCLVYYTVFYKMEADSE